MKKRNKTYALLVVVFCIWGIIIYKFVGALNPSTEIVSQASNEEIFVPQKVKKRDLFAMKLDYRDPFLGTVEAPNKRQIKKKVPTVQKKEAPKKVIQYTGLIERKNSAQKIFFVTVEGQQQMMKLNDTFQEVKLVKGSKTSIRVRYNGKTETINRSK